MARRAAGFAMPVVYTARRRLEPDQEAALGVAWRELDELLAEADFVSITPGSRRRPGTSSGPSGWPA